MSKTIMLAELNEIKNLRIACGKCHAYWSVSVSSEPNNLTGRCSYCNKVSIPENQIGYIEQLLKNLDSIQKYLKGFNIAIEFETDKEKS